MTRAVHQLQSLKQSRPEGDERDRRDLAGAVIVSSMSAACTRAAVWMGRDNHEVVGCGADHHQAPRQALRDPTGRDVVDADKDVAGEWSQLGSRLGIEMACDAMNTDVVVTERLENLDLAESDLRTTAQRIAIQVADCEAVGLDHPKASTDPAQAEPREQRGVRDGAATHGIDAAEVLIARREQMAEIELNSTAQLA